MPAVATDSTYRTARPGRVIPLLLLAAASCLPGIATSKQAAEAASTATAGESVAPSPTQMSEALRASVRKVVVLPGQSPVAQATTGSYQEQTAGLLGGAESGSRIGQGVGTEVGPVSMRIPVPILTYPGALIGGIAGKTKREIQEFRDELTKDLAAEASQPLTNDALASAVFWGLRRLPDLASQVLAPEASVAEDTDAILYVGFSGITIDAQRDDAVITTTATATLRRLSDGEHLHETQVSYQDRDTLRNWTENDKALWRDYANFARHYLGREIAAEVFDRVSLQHELRPSKTKSVKLQKKNAWHGVSRSLTPVLAWDSMVLGGGGGDDEASWAESIGEADIAYDVEIYDRRRLVYAAKQVPEPRHEVGVPLQACETYRWSVRPVYRVGGGHRFGDWMRFSSATRDSKANVGRKASEAPAYTQDFATLTIKCGGG